MTIRAVLFDFDMTLIDTSGALLANVNKIADHFGRPRCTRERLLEVIGYNSRDFWRVLLGDERPEYGEYYVEECAPYEAAMMTPAAAPSNASRNCAHWASKWAALPTASRRSASSASSISNT